MSATTDELRKIRVRLDRIEAAILHIDQILGDSHQAAGRATSPGDDPSAVPEPTDLTDEGYEGPHSYKPLAWIDRLRPWFGRCERCFVPRQSHPVPGWTETRPEGDRGSARSAWFVLTAASNQKARQAPRLKSV